MTNARLPSQVRSVFAEHRTWTSEDLANVALALGHPRRAALFALLARTAVPQTFQEIRNQTRLSRAGVSEHSRKLVDAKLVARTQRDGRMALSLHREGVLQLAGLLLRLAGHDRPSSAKPLDPEQVSRTSRPRLCRGVAQTVPPAQSGARLSSSTRSARARGRTGGD